MSKVELDVNSMGFGVLRVNGQPLENVSGVSFDARPGDMTELTVYREAIDVTAKADANVRVMVGGAEFSWEDVDRLMESPPDEPYLTGVAQRIAAMLPPREPDLDPEGKPDVL